MIDLFTLFFDAIGCERLAIKALNKKPGVDTKNSKYSIKKSYQVFHFPICSFQYFKSFFINFSSVHPLPTTNQHRQRQKTFLHVSPSIDFAVILFYCTDIDYGAFINGWSWEKIFTLGIEAELPLRVHECIIIYLNNVKNVWIGSWKCGVGSER